MTRQLLAIGECMVEMAPTQEGGFSMGYAGDTFNTAWYARQVSGADLDVAYLTAVGDDYVSHKMMAFMRDAGVRPVARVRRGRSVGLYLITLKDGERSFSYWRSVAAARTLADDLESLPGLKPGDVAFFSGISMAILPDPGKEELLAALGKARAKGVTIAFDPNLRPKLWADQKTMLGWIMRAAEVSDLVLPSFEDEAVHFGDSDKQATAERYRAAGATLMIVKDGPLPILVVSKDGQSEVPVDPAKAVVDTTAAGDSFNGQFLVSWMAGESPAQAALKASQLSRHVISARGALVPCP